MTDGQGPMDSIGPCGYEKDNQVMLPNHQSMFQ